jgi:hypothetical protein
MKRAPALALALLLSQAGCGASSPSHSAGYRYEPKSANVPACAHAGKPIQLPATFPRQFPFLPGTDIDATHPLLTKQQIGIYGYVPSSGFASTVNFYKVQVPKRGFKLVYLEVDSPNDSEGTYQGHGSVGRWQLQSLPGCPRAMRFSVSAEPSK